MLCNGSFSSSVGNKVITYSLMIITTLTIYYFLFIAGRIAWIRLENIVRLHVCVPLSPFAVSLNGEIISMLLKLVSYISFVLYSELY